MKKFIPNIKKQNPHDIRKETDEEIRKMNGIDTAIILLNDIITKWISQMQPPEGTVGDINFNTSSLHQGER